VSGNWLGVDEAGLSQVAWNRLALSEGDLIAVSHPPPLRSMSKVRGKIYGKRFSADDLQEIVSDIVAERYSGVQLSSFVTACSALPLDFEETVDLTRAMVDAGDRLEWGRHPVVDKHSVGGLPGNRTTPIVVSIVTACGLTMPKTSSRAITSPAGTADTMETMAPVDLDIPAMRRVVDKVGGCIVWGGSAHLSPADDLLIRIERALDLDSESQLIASVLSKKIAAGSTHLVLDLPVGPTAKVRSQHAAEVLSLSLAKVAAEFGLITKTLISDGNEPVGRRIGPALEARDVMAVLQGAAGAPLDLQQRAVRLAAALIDLATGKNDGDEIALRTLSSGVAWRKFQEICEAQGGMREPPLSVYRQPITSERTGRLSAIDNRRLAIVAKLAGAPEAKAAGVELHVRVGDRIDKGAELFTIHAATPGELTYALDYVAREPDIFEVTV
jgi:thymidine phosphorylase